ncbi:MAG: hypothetical protein QXN97_05195 [Desulfurococcaceae archaeon]
MLEEFRQHSSSSLRPFYCSGRIATLEFMKDFRGKLDLKLLVVSAI